MDDLRRRCTEGTHEEADPVRARRRLRLQDPARRAGGRRRNLNTVPDAPNTELIVGLETGDDAAVVRLPGSRGGLAAVATADFFTPVVDDPYDWGRIAAANALSDVYAVGGRPLVAVNLLAWPREVLPFDLAREVLRGGLDVAAEAGCHVGGGHGVDDPEPKYGMAVTGVADPANLLRNDTGKPGVPLTLTKPLGLGILNNRHKATGEVFPHAVAAMVKLNREASAAALDAGAVCATDVTGFGLLGHLYKLARASGVTAVVDAAAVPYLDGARESLRDGYVSGGTRRNLDWVAPHRLRRHARSGPAAARRRADVRRPPRRGRDPRRADHRRTRPRRGAPARRPLDLRPGLVGDARPGPGTRGPAPGRPDRAHGGRDGRRT